MTETDTGTLLDMTVTNSAVLDELLKLLLTKGVITNQERLSINRQAEKIADNIKALREGNHEQG